MSNWEDNEFGTSMPQGSLPGDGTPNRSRLGCLFYGCAIPLMAFLILMVIASFLGFRFLKGQLQKFTSDEPAALPVVEMSAEELAEVETRVNDFKESLEEGESSTDLVLTADEINALINSQPQLKGRLFVTIKDGRIAGDVSIPTDFLPGGKGRFFNASGTFDVTLENGVLIVTLASATVQGNPVPAEFIEQMRGENLARDAYNDPEVAETLRKFESLTIVDDKIILTPRVPKAVAATTEESSEPAPAEQPTDQAVPSVP